MRITKDERAEIIDNILGFLKKQPEHFFNLSEISRAINRSQPTVTKLIKELETKKQVTVLNKRSMSLVRLSE